MSLSCIVESFDLYFGLVVGVWTVHFFIDPAYLHQNWYVKIACSSYSLYINTMLGHINCILVRMTKNLMYFSENMHRVHKLDLFPEEVSLFPEEVETNEKVGISFTFGCEIIHKNFQKTKISYPLIRTKRTKWIISWSVITLGGLWVFNLLYLFYHRGNRSKQGNEKH